MKAEALGLSAPPDAAARTSGPGRRPPQALGRKGLRPTRTLQRHGLKPRAFSSASSSNRARTSELLSLLRTCSSCSWLAAEAGRGRRAGLAVLQPQLELVEIAQLLVELRVLEPQLLGLDSDLLGFAPQQLHSLLVAGIATPVEQLLRRSLRLRQPQPPARQ